MLVVYSCKVFHTVYGVVFSVVIDIKLSYSVSFLTAINNHVVLISKYKTQHVRKGTVVGLWET